MRKNCIAQSVLSTPSDEDEYLRRVSRLVRRQVRRARDAGITCAATATRADREAILEALTPRVPGMADWVDTLPDRDEDQWWVARDSAGRAVAFAIVVVDRNWAMLELLKSTDHAARYLLHTEIATALGRAGVNNLFTDSPMVFRMDPNLRRLQRMLGYRIVHLLLADDRGPRLSVPI